MILLRIPPLPPGARAHNLRRDRPVSIPLFPDLPSNIISDGGLLVRMREDSATVLRARVGALPVQRRGVVHAIEEFEEAAVGDDLGVIG